MKNFTFNIPTKVFYGIGKIKELDQIIPSRFSRILLVTDKGIVEHTDIIKTIRSLLTHREIFVYDEVEENPSFHTADNGGAIAQTHGVQLIIGIGGGSSMDAAKGFSIIATNPGSMKDYIEGREPVRPPLPVLAIPTTSGTGSEVTPFAVFTDPESLAKNGYAHDSIFPIIALIDPQLSYSMPINVIVATGLDVLAHAVEAYLSTESYHLNDQLALNAIALVVANLEKAVQKEPVAMDNMSYASMLAGMAITHASTILPHIMGYPLTVYHDVAHGIAGAIMLPGFIDYLKEKNLEMEKTAVLDSCFKHYGGIAGFISRLGVSLNLSDYGVSQEELDTFVQKTIVKGDIKITPGEVIEDVIKKIYLATSAILY